MRPQRMWSIVLNKAVGAASYVASSSVTWTAIGLAGAVLGLLYVYQDKMLYVSEIPNLPKRLADNPKQLRSPEAFGMPYEHVFINTADNVKLSAWMIFGKTDPQNLPTIVFFHGNAGNMGFRLPNLSMLHKNMACNILAVDYRGYGDSEGVPNEVGLELDALAVLDYVKSRTDIDPTKIVLFGRSLGGAVAIYLAHARKDEVAAVIVENTFYNVSEMVDKLFAFLGRFKFLVLRIYWPSHKRVPEITAPILFLCGEKDELIPPDHMVRLHDLATSSRERAMHRVKDGAHNDTWMKGGVAYLVAIRSFLERHAPAVGDNLPPPLAVPTAEGDTGNVKDYSVGDAMRSIFSPGGMEQPPHQRRSKRDVAEL